MATILAFAGSNSSTSINHKLVSYFAEQIKDVDVQLLRLSELNPVMYSEDEQREYGFPEEIEYLYNQIKNTHGLLISVNEHNGNPSAFLKNILDWLSRMDRKFLEGKKILLLSTSNGARGGLGSLEVIKNMLPRFGGEIVDAFPVPTFKENFSERDFEFTNTGLKSELLSKLDSFTKEVQEYL